MSRKWGNDKKLFYQRLRKGAKAEFQDGILEICFLRMEDWQISEIHLPNNKEESP